MTENLRHGATFHVSARHTQKLEKLQVGSDVWFMSAAQFTVAHRGPRVVCGWTASHTRALHRPIYNHNPSLWPRDSSVTEAISRGLHGPSSISAKGFPFTTFSGELSVFQTLCCEIRVSLHFALA